MADNIPVTFETGTLAPPACYTSEQERYIAYFAATQAYIAGTNLQWIVSSTTPMPADQGKAWLKIDANGYPREILLWVAVVGTWVRIFTVPHYPVTSGGVANALTLTFNPTFLSQDTGERFWFIAAATNTGACTLKVDGLTAASIKKKVNVDLQAGEILQGQVVECIWDGTNYQMVSVAGKSNIDIGDIAAGTNGQIVRTRLIGSTLTSIWENVYETAYASAQAIPAAGASVTFTHGLTIDGVATLPGFYNVYMICTDAAGDATYNQYDTVPWDNVQVSPQSETQHNQSIWANANFIGAVRSTDSTTLRVNTKTGGSILNDIDTSKWKLIARAML